jgi:hypothetical protein
MSKDKGKKGRRPTRPTLKVSDETWRLIEMRKIAHWQKTGEKITTEEFLYELLREGGTTKQKRTVPQSKKSLTEGTGGIVDYSKSRVREAHEQLEFIHDYAETRVVEAILENIRVFHENTTGKKNSIDISEDENGVPSASDRSRGPKLDRPARKHHGTQEVAEQRDLASAPTGSGWSGN